jgi:hypothetical protein
LADLPRRLGGPKGNSWGNNEPLPPAPPGATLRAMPVGNPRCAEGVSVTTARAGDAVWPAPSLQECRVARIWPGLSTRLQS